MKQIINRFTLVVIFTAPNATTMGEAVKAALEARADLTSADLTYEGQCACLVGTVANVKGCRYDAIKGLSPNAGRPAEKWFLGIHAGDTPANNQIARITEGWLLDWVKEHSPSAAEAIAADDAAVAFLDKFNTDRLTTASALSTGVAP